MYVVVSVCPVVSDVDVIVSVVDVSPLVDVSCRAVNGVPAEVSVCSLNSVLLVDVVVPVPALHVDPVVSEVSVVTRDPLVPSVVVVVAVVVVVVVSDAVVSAEDPVVEPVDVLPVAIVHVSPLVISVDEVLSPLVVRCSSSMRTIPAAVVVSVSMVAVVVSPVVADEVPVSINVAVVGVVSDVSVATDDCVDVSDLTSDVVGPVVVSVVQTVSDVDCTPPLDDSAVVITD